MDEERFDPPPSDRVNWRRGLLPRARQLMSRPRVIGEVSWVVFGRISEFILMFATLKITTTLMSQAEVGAYQLVQSWLAIVGTVLLGPIQNAYHRYLHIAEARNEQREAGMVLIRWYAIATVSVVLIGVLAADPISRTLEIGVLASMMAGGIFFFDRWRTIAIEILEIRRLRRQSAILISGHLALQAFLFWFSLTQLAPVATTALSAQFVAASIFGVVGLIPLLRTLTSRPGGATTELRSAIWRFGVPFSFIQVCQWLQFNIDRMMIDHLMDKSSVGLYVAAHQVCGVPFMLMVTIGTWLVVPVAYQRAEDVSRPSRLWSANRIVLGGLAAYCVVGLLAVAILAWIGPQLVVSLTSPEYELSSFTIFAICAGRYLQCMALLIQPIFGIHQQMTSSLVARLAGAMLSIPVCWLGISWGGLLGAAVANVVVGVVYGLILVLGPGGCLWLIIESRKDVTGDRSES